MPELPEVETIVRELNREIAGKKIQKIEVKLPKMVMGKIVKIEGLKIQKIIRRAKLIIIEISGGFRLAIHLKLTGQLFYIPKNMQKTKTGESESKYTHVIFYFTDGSKLLFNDLRQFGWIKVLTQEELEKELKKENYGPEPLSKDFNFAKFKEVILKRKKAQIKPVLMDQTIIAGIGNIYSDEALYLAKIHPKRKVSEISESELKKLYKAILKVLKEAIFWRGTSIDSYRRTSGEKGTYEKHRRVYQREGELCQRCGSKIERIKIGARSAHFCPGCQH